MSLTSYRAAPPRVCLFVLSRVALLEDVFYLSYRPLAYLRTCYVLSYRALRYLRTDLFLRMWCVLMFLFLFMGQEGLAATYSPVP